MFPGSLNRRTPVEGFLREPISAQYIRINPQAWHNNIALRMDIFGCDVGSKACMRLSLHRSNGSKHQISLFKSSMSLLLANSKCCRSRKTIGITFTEGKGAWLIAYIQHVVRWPTADIHKVHAEICQLCCAMGGSHDHLILSFLNACSLKYSTMTSNVHFAQILMYGTAAKIFGNCSV